MPRRGTTKEVHENVDKGFKIILTSLFDAQMGVDGGITSGSQVLVLPVRDMKVGLQVAEFVCKTKVNGVDLITILNARNLRIQGGE